MDVTKISLLKARLTKESVGTAMILDVVDFVDNIVVKCNVRGSKLSDKEIEVMLLTTNYLLSKKASVIERK